MLKFLYSKNSLNIGKKENISNSLNILKTTLIFKKKLPDYSIKSLNILNPI